MYEVTRVLGIATAESAHIGAVAERCYASAYAALLKDNSLLAAKLFGVFALLRPRDARSWVGLSVCCERSGLDEAAVGLYRVGAELCADDAHSCHLGRARALERLGRIDAAREARDEALAAAPSSRQGDGAARNRRRP